MTQIIYRANLTASELPLLAELQGRNVIVGQIDQNFSRQLSSVKNKDRDVGIPQAYYCHNVIPTDAGFSSTGFLALATPPGDSDGTFSEMYLVRDTNNNAAYFVNTTSGRCYVLFNLATGWVRTTDKAPTAGLQVSIAHVNGQTYICFGGTGTFKYNFATNVLDAVTLTATNPANVLGIVAANGYMAAWTTTTVVWSSIIDPTDFTPSLVTGAGGGGVQNIRGDIVVCLAHSLGFIIYTKRNAVGAAYTGNPQYPFTYKEVVGSGGLSNANQMSYDANGTDHRGYTTSGLQSVNMTQTQLIYPQVTDFLAGSQFEDYDETTSMFTTTTLTSTMLKKVTLISDRYLVISYGISTYTHALVYDFGLDRWGKIKTTHVDCFEYSILNSGVTEIPKRSMGFLDANGNVKVVTMSYDTTGSYGVILLGKYQYVRSQYITLQDIHLESIKIGADLTIKILSSMDGKNYTISIPTLVINNGTYRRYNSRVTGLNHSISINGAFQLHSLELKFIAAGAVR